ncbi:MAG TPA: DUF1622 domain-containing protein [Sphingomicrobium sp.]|nr:DUF1622 domain-containing protein [Sphingomicrobium sp.]
MMESWIHQLGVIVSATIEVAMIATITVGTAHALWRVLDCVVHRQALATAIREIWLHYASWILLALEFALAADLIKTVIAPDWEEIGQLGAIAAVRVVLGYFLGRDVAEYRS